MTRTAVLIASLLLAVACGDDSDPPLDAGADTAEPDVGTPDVGVDAPVDAGPDTFDAGTPCDGPPGLYVDEACETIASDVLGFNPRFWLWSDGTDKERFISIPEGAMIETTNPDRWVFPIGTRIWKTFSMDGVRLETRYFEKVSGGAGLPSWVVRTYQWNEDQDAVFEITDGATDVLGTGHDIPAVALCQNCHSGGGGVGDLLLGVSALQLNHDDTGVALEDLFAMGWITTPVPVATAEIPTDDDVTREALGYMHANCGHCHRQGPGAPSGLSLEVLVGLETLDDTGAYQTAVGVNSVWMMGSPLMRVTPGDPDTSSIYLRPGIRGDAVNQMPPVATELVDDVGRDAIREWILSLE